VPAAQLEQTAAPATANVPSGQLAPEAEPLAQNEPEEQLAQLVVPELLLYIPLAQGEQLVDPVLGW